MKKQSEEQQRVEKRAAREMKKQRAVGEKSRHNEKRRKMTK